MEAQAKILEEYAPRVYEFGEFRLDAAERVLSRNGEEAQLTPKVFDILLLLLENRGRLVEKRELMDRIWPDINVEESNLVVSISTLRKALGDDASHPQFIATAPKHGYRFIADVRETRLDEGQLVISESARTRIVVKNVEAAPNRVSAALARVGERLQERLSAASPRQIAAGLGAVFIGVAMAAAAVIFFWPRPSSTPPTLQFTEVFSKRGQEGEMLARARFSPDGRMIAFSATGDGYNLWVRQINGGAPHPVTRENWRDSSPVWSPSGDEIAFVSNRGRRIGIWKTPFLGGTPELLKTLAESEAVPRGGWPRLVAWAKSGVYYELNADLFRLDLTTKEVARVAGQQQPGFRYQPDFALSPDEKEIAYIAHQDQRFDVWRMALDGGAPARVTNDAEVDGRPRWLPDGKLLYNSTRDGRLQIYRVDPAGGEPALLSTGDQHYTLSDVSADGSKLLCYKYRDESDVFAADVETGQERQITDEIGAEFWASASPDGESVIYQALRGENFVWDPRRSLLFRRPLAADRQPMQLAVDAFDAQWAPRHGEIIAFLRQAESLFSLWTVRTVGGEEQKLVEDGVSFAGQRNSPPYNRVQTSDYSWAPDAGRIAYSAWQDNLSNIWVVSVPQTEKQQISFNRDPALRLRCPLWSPDGGRIAYVGDNGETPPTGAQTWSLWVANPEKAEKIYQTESVLRLLGWAENGKLIVALTENVTGGRSQPKTIRLVSVSPGGADPRELGRLVETYLNNVHLSPDGRNVSFVSAQEGRDDIWLVSLAGGQMGEPKKIISGADRYFFHASLSWSPDGKTIYHDKQTRWNILAASDLLR